MFYFFSNGRTDIPQISWPKDGSRTVPESWGTVVLGGSVITTNSCDSLNADLNDVTYLFNDFDLT